jgi:hypothetical protein
MEIKRSEHEVEYDSYIVLVLRMHGVSAPYAVIALENSVYILLLTLTC